MDRYFGQGEVWGLPSDWLHWYPSHPPPMKRREGLNRVSSRGSYDPGGGCRSAQTEGCCKALLQGTCPLSHSFFLDKSLIFHGAICDACGRALALIGRADQGYQGGPWISQRGCITCNEEVSQNEGCKCNKNVY